MMIDYNISNREKIFFILFSLHQITMYFIFYDAFKSYFTYIPLLSFLLFFSLKDRKSIYCYFLVLILLIFSYSVFSFLNKSFNKDGDYLIKDGVYTITEKKIRARVVGSITSQDKILEPTNYNDLYLQERNGNHFVLKCSILENGCPFYSEFGESIFVKYIEIQGWGKYSLYIRKGNYFYSENYFTSKYREEKNIKLLFIVFYELISILFILIFVFHKNNKK
jgi:hypothetical protein